MVRNGVHTEWNGFAQLRNADGVIVGAQCLKCKRTRTRRDRKSLANHKKICTGFSGQPLREANENRHNTEKSAGVGEISKMPENNENAEADLLDSVLNYSTSPANVSSHDLFDISSKRQENYRKNVLLMKFFLSCGLDFETIESLHLKNLFQAFDPNFRLPSLKEFKTQVLKNTHDEMCKEIATYKYSNIISVQSYETDTKLHVISLAMHSKMQYVFIDYCIIENSGSDIAEKLECFCDASVKKFFNERKVSIEYAIYDGKYFLSSDGRVDNIVYNRLPCMSLLLHVWKHNHEPFVIRGQEDFDKCTRYYKRIDDLEKKFNSPDCSLGEATECILESYYDKTFELSTSMEGIIFKFLSGAALTANYLNPNYKGRYFDILQPITDMTKCFVETYLPLDAFEGFAAYKTNTEAFQRLRPVRKEYDYKRFWFDAGLVFQSLSNFAMQLFYIPAIPRKIDVKKFIELQNQFSQTKCCNEKLIISLFLNESA